MAGGHMKRSIVRRLRKAVGAVAVLAGCMFLVVVLYVNGQVPADASGNILKNASFETLDRGVPIDWKLESKVAPKGRLSVSTSSAHSGQSVLKLEPNQKNSPW